MIEEEVYTLIAGPFPKLIFSDAYDEDVIIVSLETETVYGKILV